MGEFNAVLNWCGVLRTAHKFFDSVPDLASELLSVVGFGGGGSRLGTFFGDVSSFAAEQAEVLLETALSLCLRELAVFSELQGKVRVGLLLVSIATASVSVTGVARVALSTIIIFIFIGILSGVCFFVALPFIVRMLVLVGGQIFSGHLRVALQISGVNGLGEGMEFVEGVRFADVGDLILDAGQKSAIHLSAEGGIAPLDAGG